MLFLDWNYVVFDPKNYLDEYFSFALSSESTANSPHSQIPFEVTLVPKAGEWLYFHSINSSETRLVEAANHQMHLVPGDVPQRLDIDMVLSTIRKWMAGCDRYHPECNCKTNSLLPKRVLHIPLKKEEPIKLEQLEGIEAPYIALR